MSVIEMTLTDPKKQLEFYKQLSEQLQQKNKQLKKENKILRENAEHNDKVVDKVNWDNGMFKVAIKFLETDDEILGDYLLRIDKSNVDYEVVGTIFDKEVK